MKKVALYCRVSTEEQSTDIQTLALKEYCEKNNLQFELFEDFYTGRTTKRPELQRMMSRIDEFEAVYIWRTDRLSRSIMDSLTIVKSLLDAGVKLVSLCDPFDLSSASGRMAFNMKIVINQYEVELIRERTKAGMAAAKKRGNLPGPKGRPFDTATYLQLKKSGLTMADIARQMGFSRSQLFERLKSVG